MEVNEIQPLLARKRQAGEILGGLSDSTLWRLARDGEIDAIHIGRAVFYTVESLQAFVDRRREAVAS